MDREYLSGDLRQRMQDLLKERKITQAEIAAQMEMSEAALSRFFSSDTAKLSSEAVRKAALYLNVSTDFLIGLSDFPERYNYDISELGLSHKAALVLYTGAVNNDVVNRMETQSIGQTEWETLSPEEKRETLIAKQKKMLDTFREKNAISQEQYEDGMRYLHNRP